MNLLVKKTLPVLFSLVANTAVANVMNSTNDQVNIIINNKLQAVSHDTFTLLWKDNFICKLVPIKVQVQVDTFIGDSRIDHQKHPAPITFDMLPIFYKKSDSKDDFIWNFDLSDESMDLKSMHINEIMNSPDCPENILKKPENPLPKNTPKKEYRYNPNNVEV